MLIEFFKVQLVAPWEQMVPSRVVLLEALLVEAARWEGL
jgi:hypothetical protein